MSKIPAKDILTTTTPDQRVDRILKIYAMASAEDKREGRRWYAKAQNFSRELAQQHGCKPIAAAGIVAALSPGSEWRTNKMAAERLIEGLGKPIPATEDNRAKARAILALKRPTRKAILKILNGPKVSDFFRGIRGDHDLPTIDGHAYNIWAGKKVDLKKVPHIGKRLRATITADYIAAAEILGIPALHVQATTWIVWRRLPMGHRLP